MTSRSWSPRLFLYSLVSQRRDLAKRFFNEGPGFLLLPLWLIVASMLEPYLPQLWERLF